VQVSLQSGMNRIKTYTKKLQLIPASTRREVNILSAAAIKLRQPLGMPPTLIVKQVPARFGLEHINPTLKSAGASSPLVFALIAYSKATV
jgi:hypothetical protein